MTPKKISTKYLYPQKYSFLKIQKILKFIALNPPPPPPPPKKKREIQAYVYMKVLENLTPYCLLVNLKRDKDKPIHHTRV